MPAPKPTPTTRSGAVGTVFAGGALVTAGLAVYRARTGVELDFSEAEVAAFTTLANLTALGVAPVLSALRGAVLRLLGAGLVVLLAFPLAGCALSHGTVTTVTKGDLRPIEVTSTRLSVLRKGVFHNETALWSDGTVVQRQVGCDESMSGNLGYATIGVAGLVAGPIGAAAAGAGVAATEYAKRQDGQLDHTQYACDPFVTELEDADEPADEGEGEAPEE